MPKELKGWKETPDPPPGERQRANTLQQLLTTKQRPHLPALLRPWHSWGSTGRRQKRGHRDFLTSPKGDSRATRHRTWRERRPLIRGRKEPRRCTRPAGLQGRCHCHHHHHHCMEDHPHHCRRGSPIVPAWRPQVKEERAEVTLSSAVKPLLSHIPSPRRWGVCSQKQFSNNAGPRNPPFL